MSNQAQRSYQATWRTILPYVVLPTVAAITTLFLACGARTEPEPICDSSVVCDRECDIRVLATAPPGGALNASSLGVDHERPYWADIAIAPDGATYSVIRTLDR